MSRGRHEQQTRDGLGTPIIDDLNRIRDDRSFPRYFLDADWVNFLFEIFGIEFLDDLPGLPADSDAIGFERLHIDLCAEFCHAGVGHLIGGVDDAHVHLLPPASLCEELFRPCHEHVYSYIFDTGEVQQNPRDGVFTDHFLYLVICQPVQDLVFDRWQSGLRHFCRMGHGVLLKEELDGCVAVTGRESAVELLMSFIPLFAVGVHGTLFPCLECNTM